MKQIELLKLAENILQKNEIQEANIKAKKLLEFVLNQTRSEFILHELEEVDIKKEQKLMSNIYEILKGRPIQYITQNQEFMGLNFYVDENVLIPQPDTEILVEQVVKVINQKYDDIQNKSSKETKLHNQKDLDKKTIQVLDLCTGSGAIAVSIAKYTKNIAQTKKLNKTNLEGKDGNIKITATDISSKALSVANKNAINNKVEKNIEFLQSDMFSNLTGRKFDIIVSNPPYIETSIIPTLSDEVKHEPVLALDGGEDGLEFYKIILENSYKYLKNDGYILLEIGYDQGKKIHDLFEKLKDRCNIEMVTKKPIKDFGGNDRVMILKK